MSSASYSRDRLRVVHFSEHDENPPRTRVLAVVIWQRLRSDNVEPGAIAGFLMDEGRPIWLRMRANAAWMRWFEFRALHFPHFRIRFVFAVARWSPSILRPRLLRLTGFSDWSVQGSSIGADNTQVKFHHLKRIVRIRGRDYKLPGDGRTLVLLVRDDPTSRRPRIDVVERAADIAPVPRVPDLGPSAVHHANAVEVETAIQKAVLADPEVARFVNDQPKW